LPYTRVQMRRGTQTEWVTNNPTLAPGEFGLNLTNGKIKMGTGTIAWNSLEYFAESAYELAVRIDGFIGSEQDWLDSLVGPRGPIGLTGDTGLTGLTGETGERGPIGLTGATGIEWQGEWNALSDYVNNDAVFFNGASWFASGDPAIGEEPDELSSHWYPLALQGVEGTAATISIGSVTTGEPEDPVVITNTGSSNAAILNFSIPKGDTGDIGSLSAESPIIYSSNTISLDYDALVIDGGSA
jgi:hypothetical protein